MAEIAKYGRLGVRLPFKCNEGNMTIVTGRTIGGDLPVPTFANPIEDGDWVKLTADWEITKCAASDTEVLGQVIGRPEFEGQQPTASKTWGNYDPRVVDVDCMAQAVRSVELEATNTEITIGNSVKPGTTTAQKFDKDATANMTKALAAAAGSSGATIPVLFGYYGAL